MKKVFTAVIFYLLGYAFLFADEVVFTASAPQVVESGERFQLIYTLNAQGRNFNVAEIEGFRHIMGPSTSTSYSTQIVNNNVTQSVTFTYTFILQAEKEGSFTLPAATVEVDGKTYSSNTVPIKVSPPSAKPKTSSRKPAPNKPSAESNQQDNSITENDIFIRAVVSNPNPYVGEQIVVTFKIYTKVVPLASLNIVKNPGFSGFWSENLMKDQQIGPSSTEIINGEEYLTADLSKMALFPQKPGELVIEPMELECVAQVAVQGARRRSNNPFDIFFNDPFFNQRVQNVEVSLKSNTLKINSKPLPLANKPANYSGVAGSFDVSSSVNHTVLKVNEAITYRIKITGRGNIELINAPEISFPPDFEVYEPKITDNISNSANGISGSRTFEYLLIPRKAGSFMIPSVNFSYFDPVKEQYIIKETNEYTIEVEKNDETASYLGYDGVIQEDVKYTATDIRHINLGPYQLAPVNYFIFNSLAFYLWLAVTSLIAIALVIVIKRYQKNKANQIFTNNRKATRVARKNLQKAKAFMNEGNSQSFFHEIAEALWGYLSNKFNISWANLKTDTIQETLREKKVSPETVALFLKTLDNTEFARFAPGDRASMMQEIYGQALEVISKIERELR